MLLVLAVKSHLLGILLIESFLSLFIQTYRELISRQYTGAGFVRLWVLS